MEAREKSPHLELHVSRSLLLAPPVPLPPEAAGPPPRHSRPQLALPPRRPAAPTTWGLTRLGLGKGQLPRKQAEPDFPQGSLCWSRPGGLRGGRACWPLPAGSHFPLEKDPAPPSAPPHLSSRLGPSLPPEDTVSGHHGFHQMSYSQALRGANASGSSSPTVSSCVARCGPDHWPPDCAGLGLWDETLQGPSNKGNALSKISKGPGARGRSGSKVLPEHPSAVRREARS